MLRDTDIGHYGFCVFEWLHQAERFMDRYDIKDPILYVFDQGSGFGREFYDALVWIKRRRTLRARFRFDDFTFGSSKSILPLQSSDILAWEARDLFEQKLFSPSAQPTTSLRLLIDRSKHVSLWHGAAELERWKRDFFEFIADCPEDDLR